VLADSSISYEERGAVSFLLYFSMGFVAFALRYFSDFSLGIPFCTSVGVQLTPMKLSL